MHLKSLKAAAAATLGLGLALLASSSAAAQTVEFRSGHIDVLAFSYDDAAQELDIQVEDHASETLYDPANVLFDVHDGHKISLGSSINCVGDAGDIWLLPREDTSGLIWAGWNTEGLNLADFGGALTADLIAANTPTGGQVSVFDPGAGPGTFDIRFHSDSACDPGGTAISETHHHAAWAFTEPGTYQLTFQVSGDHATDGAVTSDPITYTFEVGGA